MRAARDGRPLLWVSLESADEARALARLARRAGVRPDVLVRLNPAVAPETAAALAVGAPGSKFGVLPDELPDLIEAGGRPDGPLRWRGLHVHVGSQLGAVDAWRAAIRRALAVLALTGGTLEGFDTLDCGGGFPVAWPGDPAPTPESFAREAAEALSALPPDRQPARLAIEPGRAVVARSGWLVARVLHVRERVVREPAVASEAPPRETAIRQVVLDAGMTELIRPALYGARHPVVALTSLGREVEPADESESGAWEVRVEGPICESTDTLGLHPLPPLRRGDLVAIAQAGAYASSMSSTYNGRARAAEVGMDRGALRVLRPRARTRAFR
ncbi:MAG: hypothetical protein A2X23_05475 [Chloroflexi bacterium GWC2_73_18]|nr:MAG: hypothetical protein A2X23_05475 [Chloroflexi bacterium GWC2_73_18]